MNREFSLGSEWLYYKIYCGVKTADFILHDYLKETIQQLLDDNSISKWFFIRYNDPDAHLRLRFKVDQAEKLGSVISKLYAVFTVLQKENLIWKIQTDTYSREWERYGIHSYELSESLFQADSELIQDYIGLKPYFEKESTSLLFSFLSIDQFLTLFGLDQKEKLKLLDRMQLAFKKEFQADKTLKKELDKHYRELESFIISILTENKKEHFNPIYESVYLKNEKIKNTIVSLKKELEIELFSFLSSHIHMMLNRQFTSRQREYELLVYDHLYRYYKMCCFKKE
ncbi:conserved hypothetical protein [Flavobacterium sp. 9AF]|uniref:thiopeptide-type bacteriocin biosynthesis protein n=1 Tax=Flavobacterium sp. 9AF TaxID=2653142 RepID=UPI0012F1F25F|nr:thiopeptide-type bacteriocin biosynthesis protein [Flavobacterium sp. 9AF]VXB14570.1 conserved hypothetical protein [Flavobacterium sp. 9AF]